VIIGIRRLSTAWPVVNLARKIRAGTRVDVGGDIESLLRRQLLCAVDRHQRVNEGGRGIDARHPRANIVRVTTPKWWSERGTLATGAMTTTASGRENGHASSCISLYGSQSRKALTFHLRANRNSVGEKCEVSDNIAHVPAVGAQATAVHAALEAVVDPVLDEIDFTAAFAVLGKARVASDPRHRIAAQSAVDMTTGAAERVADVAR